MKFQNFPVTYKRRINKKKNYLAFDNSLSTARCLAFS